MTRMTELYKTYILSLVISLLASKTFAQTILNGDFEVNNAPNGVDQIALTNGQFNSTVSNCTSFGSSTTGLDLITTNNWDGPPYSGNWYMGIEGGGIEQFSMALSVPLDSGVVYKIRFFDRGRAVHPPAPIEIGISMFNNNFGNLIYTAPAPEYGVWNLRCFSFVATLNAEYITIRGGGSIGSWAKIDKFILEIDSLTSCNESSILIMPNIFTPNSDNINDVFIPIKLENIFNANLIIQNRWGNIVFESNDFVSGWNGEQNSDGVYFWQIQYTDIMNNEIIEHGFVHLLR